MSLFSSNYDTYQLEVLKTQQHRSKNDKMHYIGPGWSLLILVVGECTQLI